MASRKVSIFKLFPSDCIALLRLKLYLWCVPWAGVNHLCPTSNPIPQIGKREALKRLKKDFFGLCEFVQKKISARKEWQKKAFLGDPHITFLGRGGIFFVIIPNELSKARKMCIAKL